MPKRIILGVTGYPASGKDTLSNYLVDHYEFSHLSTSDIVRTYIKENNLGEMTRPLVRETATQLRQKFGGDYLMKEALKDPHPRLIISGIRSLGEAETLKKAGGKLIALDVPIEQRYQWAAKRKRASDQISFEQFRAKQEDEEKNQNINDCNVNAVLAMADYSLSDYKDFEDFYQKIDQLMSKILQ